MPQEMVGVIGLGTMGMRMAKHLVSVGVPVMGYDVRPGVAAALPFQATSPAELAAQVSYIICMLPHPDVFREVVLGDQGLTHGLRSGAIVIDMSTNGPGVDRECEPAIQARGAHLMDAPVGRGMEAAAAGKLIILAGGDPTVVERARWVLEHVGQEVVYCGPLGSGQVIKIANNLGNCLNLVAAVEAYQLATRYGADGRLLLRVMQGTAADNHHVRHTAPRALDGEFSPGFKVSLALKDLNLAITYGEALHLDLPTAHSAVQWYDAAVAAGDGDLDMGALFKLLQNHG